MKVLKNKRFIVFIILILLLSLYGGGIFQDIYSGFSARDEYNNLYTDYVNMSENLANKTTYEARKAALLQEIQDSDINKKVTQDEIINILGKLSIKNNIEMGNIKFEESIGSFTETDREENPLEEIQAPESMKVTLDFSSSFDNMISYIDDIKKYSDKTALTDISILFLDAEEVKVTVNLIIYTLSLPTMR